MKQTRGKQNQYNMYRSLQPRKLLQSTVVDTVQLLRGSRKRKQFVLGDLQWISTLNLNQQQKVQNQLQSLANDTKSYQQQLRLLREQLNIKQSKNTDVHHKKIEEMNEEFQRHKDYFDIYKLGIYMAKKDLELKSKIYLTLKIKAYKKLTLRIKQKAIKDKIINNVLNQALNKKQQCKGQDISYKIYLNKLKGNSFNILKFYAYNSILSKLRDKIKNTSPKVLQVSSRHVLLQYKQQFQQNVKPIFVQKVKKIQKKQKLKIVKIPSVKPPKIMKKRQQIILKAPPHTVNPPNAVTVHLKVQPKQQTHKHQRCHKHSRFNNHSHSNTPPPRNEFRKSPYNFGQNLKDQQHNVIISPTKYGQRHFYEPYQNRINYVGGHKSPQINKRIFEYI